MARCAGRGPDGGAAVRAHRGPGGAGGVTVSGPARLAVGGEVGLRGSSYTITALAGGAVALAGVTGEVVAMPVAELLADASFAVLTPRPRAPLPARGVLDGLPAEVAARAQWWERHVTEVLTGVPAGSPPGTIARAEYDPLRVSLRQRELSKVAELRAAGEPVSLATLGRMRRRYQGGGLLGLVDGRLIRGAGRAVDERVITAIEKAVAGETDRSTGTVTRLRRQVARSLAAEYGIDPAQVMPPRATFYRLAAQVSAGRHTFGSAPTRRSLAQRPDGPFGAVTVLRPGEWCPVDSTPLDVRVVLDDGLVDRAELTMMVDVATRTIAAAVLRPTTKAVDASLLLARALTPEPMRPGWPDALRMSRSVLPHQRLVGDRRAAGACGGAAGDRPGDGGVRPRHGLPVAGVPGRVPCDGRELPAHPPRLALGEGHGGADLCLRRLPVRPVRRRLCRAQRGPARQERRAGRGLVTGRTAGPAR